MGRRERERDQKQRKKVESDGRRINIGRDHNRQSNDLRRIADRKLLKQAATKLFDRIGNDNKRMLADIVKASAFDWEAESVTHSTHDPMDSDAFMVRALSLVRAVRASKPKSHPIWSLFSEAPPEVNFALDWSDAEVLIANALREERQLGLLDGLDLADAADAVRP